MSRFLNRRQLILLLADAVVILLSCLMSFFFVNLTDFISLSLGDTWLQMLLFVGCNMLGLSACGVYRNMWRYAGIRDFVWCGCGVMFGSVASYILVRFALHIEVSDVYNAFCVCITICAVVGIRIVYRYVRDKVMHYARNTVKSRTLLVGAGDACHLILPEMMEASSKYLPVCIADDNPEKISRSIHGVKVQGPTDRIPELCKKNKIATIIFAIPSCPDEERRRILGICSATGCEVKIIPYLRSVISSESILHQVKSIELEDLLNREPIRFDDSDVRALLSNKVCMVTGGGGSIGSELCRQIMQYGPKKLIIVDVYENNAYDIQQELVSEYQGAPNVSVQIASVRDYDKMATLFEQFRPQMLFHAAAHKHVPLMETNPEEAIKNNVIGTFNVARLAAKYQVNKMVLVSTDKAVNPTNVMGATKRCCEMILQFMQQQETKTEFVAVRFGNVLGSNGSVVPLFRKQIEKGGPVTVTHPDIIRYFMTIPEAVSLILQAATMAKGGEVFVLDMGDPVKITTLAENLIRLYGYEPYVDMKIKFTGLRPGEKLYEELLMSEEGLQSTANKKIFIGNQIPIDTQDFLEKIGKLKDDAEHNAKGLIVQDLYELVPSFHHEGPQDTDDSVKINYQ